MAENRFTATQIGDILADALEYSDESRSNLRHRVRYLAKKHHLLNGCKIDERGTLEFPKSEVYRAALYCEFLGLSMDIKVAAQALQQAEDFKPFLNKPESARVDGGWNFSGGLSSAVRGVGAGEKWKLVILLQRSGHSTEAGLKSFYTWENDRSTDVDAILGREGASTALDIDLCSLFGSLLHRIGQVE